MVVVESLTKVKYDVTIVTFLDTMRRSVVSLDVTRSRNRRSTWLKLKMMNPHFFWQSVERRKTMCFYWMKRRWFQS